jgi:DNA mismatch repair protein MutL
MRDEIAPEIVHPSPFIRRPPDMPVRILPEELINKIAAGEVVERPASVVKELVENAIDAGATIIEVTLQSGGRKLIEVSDNGSGMSEVDARLALERHATSKIASFGDLEHVGTLGFRGEALPSIASVSRFTLVTWDGVSPHGTEIRRSVAGGLEILPAARDRGTTIRVEELFENVPARRKFLRSADAEFRAIVTVVSSYALPHPSRAFRLHHGGRMVLDLPPASSHRERAVQVLGLGADRDLAEIEFVLSDCAASGFVSRQAAYASRRNQYFFVNSRLVRDRVLTHAANRAIEAFDAERFPAVVLFLRMNTDLVDVNVHPAKTEVRFRDSAQVHVAVEQGIKRALGVPEAGASLLTTAEPPMDQPFLNVDGPTSGDEGPQTLTASGGWSTPEEHPPIAESSRHVAYEVTPLFRRGAVVQPPPARFESPESSSLHGRILGQYRDSYIILETTAALRLIDQHAAHERVLFDRIRGRFGQSITGQHLLEPLLYEAGPAEAALLESHLEELRAVGFEIEPFSRNSFAISTIPTVLRRESVPGFFRKLIDASVEERGSHVERVRDKVIASLACHAAIKVHRPMSSQEISQLTADLLQSSNPFACPHGRPVIVDIAHLDIERHFHRR